MKRSTCPDLLPYRRMNRNVEKNDMGIFTTYIKPKSFSIGNKLQRFISLGKLKTISLQ